MKSKVVNCIALFSGSEICFCSKDDYKICPKRIKGDLDCIESIVRVTPVDRSVPNTKDSPSLIVAKDIDPRLSDSVDNFKSMLDHLDRIKK